MRHPLAPATPSGPTLGTIIRAARCGWEWCPSLGAWMRIGPWLGGGHRIELIPGGQEIPTGGPGRSEPQLYRRWWEYDHDGGCDPVVLARVTEVVAGKARPCRLRRAVEFALDDVGEVVW